MFSTTKSLREMVSHDGLPHVTHEDNEDLCKRVMTTNLSPTIQSGEKNTRNRLNKVGRFALIGLCLVSTRYLAAWSPWENGLHQASISNGNKSLRLASRSLQEIQSSSNIFDRQLPTFSVFFGTARAGCRSPPSSPLVLDCKGGNLEILYSTVKCEVFNPGSARCDLGHSSAKANEFEWTQGLVVATCDSESFTDFRSSFFVEYPTVCMGVPANTGDERDLSVGMADSYLLATQMCETNKGEMFQFLPSSCQDEDANETITFKNATLPICRAADICRVPKCPQGFHCTGMNLCKVTPHTLSAVKTGGGDQCQELGYSNVGMTDEVWEVLKKQVPSPDDLLNAGVGSSFPF